MTTWSVPACDEHGRHPRCQIGSESTDRCSRAAQGASQIPTRPRSSTAATLSRARIRTPAGSGTTNGIANCRIFRRFAPMRLFLTERDTSTPESVVEHQFVFKPRRRLVINGRIWTHHTVFGHRQGSAWCRTHLPSWRSATGRGLPEPRGVGGRKATPVSAKLVAPRPATVPTRLYGHR